MKKLIWHLRKYSRDDYYTIKQIDQYLCIFKSIALVTFFATFFYRSIWAVFGLFPIGIAFYIYLCHLYIEKEKERLEIQFKEFIISLSANLRAGYSAENAVVHCKKDMTILFGDKSLIQKELMWITEGLQNNTTVEELLIDFGKKSKIAEIKEFASVFSIAKRNGGNLSSIITDTTVILTDRLEMQRESQVLISGKKYEQKIMSAIPFFIALYIEVFTPGYFAVLYHTVSGVCIMTVCLILYVVAYMMGQKIISIKF